MTEDEGRVLETIKKECISREKCDGCRFYKKETSWYVEYYECALNSAPDRWNLGENNEMAYSNNEG